MRENGKELEANTNNVERVYMLGVDYIPVQDCIQILSKAILFILRNMYRNHKEDKDE